MVISQNKISGFTLIELVVTVAVVALVASLAVMRLGGILERSKETVALSDMAALREAFTGSPSAPGYLDDMGNIPHFSPGFLRLANLLTKTNLYVYGAVPVDEDNVITDRFTRWSSDSHRGWRGPYVKIASGRADFFPRRDSADASFFPNLTFNYLPADYRNKRAVYGFEGEPCIIDPWGRPYVLQIPPREAFLTDGRNVNDISDAERFSYARIVSAGPDGVISTPCFNSAGGSWSSRKVMLDARFAGRAYGGNATGTGDRKKDEELGFRWDDLVIFINRSDVYEEEP